MQELDSGYAMRLFVSITMHFTAKRTKFRKEF